MRQLVELVVSGTRIRRPDPGGSGPLARIEAENQSSQGTVRVSGDDGADPVQAHAGGDALEQARPELLLKPGDRSAQRRSGHGEPAGDDSSRYRVTGANPPTLVCRRCGYSPTLHPPSSLRPLARHFLAQSLGARRFLERLRD